MLIEVFKGIWLPADSVLCIYVSHEPKIKGDIRAPKEIVQRLNVYSS